jgi:hypothetical protein
MEATTKAIVLAIMAGSIIISMAIYFRPQPEPDRVSANPCKGPGPHPNYCSPF